MTSYTIAVTSFYSNVAEKIEEQGKEFSDIFEIRFEPKHIIEFTHVLKHYDDVVRSFTEESLLQSFKK